MRSARLTLWVSFALAVSCAPARLGALAITRPLRVPVIVEPLEPHDDLVITTDDGLRLQGWLFPVDEPRGLVVLVHGKDINRQHFIAAAGRFQSLGFVVLAYDQRAHGLSDGAIVTYGAREARDLCRAIDTAFASGALRAHPAVPVFLIGESLGAAVVLQTAAQEPRVRGVVAGASFSDLRTILSEKTPFFFSNSERDEAVRAAEMEGQFKVDDVSPMRAAANIEVPVLLLHGSEDRYIPFGHSIRIYEAIKAPKRLIRLEGAGHVDVLLHEEAWQEIERFVLGLAGQASVRREELHRTARAQARCGAFTAYRGPWQPRFMPPDFSRWGPSPASAPFWCPIGSRR